MHFDDQYHSAFLKDPGISLVFRYWAARSFAQQLEKNHIFHRTPWINDKCSGSDPWIESRNLSKSSSNLRAYFFFQSKFYIFLMLIVKIYWALYLESLSTTKCMSAWSLSVHSSPPSHLSQSYFWSGIIFKNRARGGRVVMLPCRICWWSNSNQMSKFHYLCFCLLIQSYLPTKS